MSSEQKNELLQYVIDTCGVGKIAGLPRLRPPDGFDRGQLFRAVRAFDQDGHIEVRNLETPGQFFRLIVNDGADDFLKSGGYKNRLLHSGLNSPIHMTTNNFNGHNARVISGNAIDNSLNIVNGLDFSVFDEAIKAIETSTDTNEDLIRSVAEMKQHAGTGSFSKSYVNFMSLAANHVTILAPFLERIAKFLLNEGG